MDQFKRDLAKSKREVRTVIAFIALVPSVGLILAGLAQFQGDRRTIENYLEQERPSVVLAIEAYKTGNGHYPDFITNDVPRYYKGQQGQVNFLAWFEYTNFQTNFFLKDFNRSR